MNEERLTDYVEEFASLMRCMLEDEGAEVSDCIGAAMLALAQIAEERKVEAVWKS